jgi:hypothetical protein
MFMRPDVFPIVDTVSPAGKPGTGTKARFCCVPASLNGGQVVKDLSVFLLECARNLFA